MTTSNETSKAFKHVYGGIELRTLLDERGNPWFLVKDVCIGLGLTGDASKHCAKLLDFERSSANSIRTWDAEVRKTLGLRSNGSAPLVVSESGLYKLIMRSKKAEAVVFQRWVTEEVLPEIRKTGSYEAGSDAPEILKDLANSINPLDATFVEAKEYCQLKELPEELKCTLGKIATRICIEQDKPKRWTNIDKKVVKKYKLKFRSVGQYPVTVLDEAYALYQQGIKE